MKFAILGGGMVGACYMQAFLEHGHSLVGLCDLQPNAAVADAVQAAGAQVHTAPGAWLAGADVVVSAVFGTVARSLFEACLPHLQDGALYVDMTTADPQEMRECAELAERSAQGRAVHFVDVAITGAVNLGGKKTPLLVAGGKAGFVQELFLPFGGSVRVVGERPGDAASLKLLRSIYTKGIEALAVECLVTAEQRGLREPLYAVLQDIDETPLRTLMESMVRTHIPHSARRRNEVAEAQQQMARHGLTPIVLPAVESLFATTAQAHAAEPFTGATTDEAIAWLGDRVLTNHP
ncbi:NAD(P)-binding domain-containing protein [Acidovorax sp. Root402]|uniref:NAD(P)-binding domain-containing protein n=1 Tax=Acidovorax sp. Root402 TaxID=1736527 RepID=UPI0009EC9E05|nr:NAD(P)-binding domain-containing protein [Acidovorax sp. Root402]